jgi:hypothetical protein
MTVENTLSISVLLRVRAATANLAQVWGETPSIEQLVESAIRYRDWNAAEWPRGIREPLRRWARSVAPALATTKLPRRFTSLDDASAAIAFHAVNKMYLKRAAAPPKALPEQHPANKLYVALVGAYAVCANTYANLVETGQYKPAPPNPRTGIERPERLAFSLTPSVRARLEIIAQAEGLTLTELLRRAVFAVEADPRLLRSRSVETLEDAYRRSLGRSRWS